MWAATMMSTPPREAALRSMLGDPGCRSIAMGRAPAMITALRSAAHE